MALGRITIAVALATSVAAGTAEASTLRGSLTSMRHQHEVAIEQDYTFLRTPAQVEEFVEKGRLEHVAGNEDYRVNNVSFPYARPEVVDFIERLGRLYHEETGEQLVVTSLTRPTALQPRNAHKLSVHPAGMAVDFRVPADAEARRWFERTLLELEGEGVLDVTRERRPPHYHVAVFPEAFAVYAAANPLPPKVVAAAPAAEPTLAPSIAAPVTMAMTPTDPGAGPGGWVFTAFAGLALAGGAVARRRLPQRVRARE